MRFRTLALLGAVLGLALGAVVETGSPGGVVSAQAIAGEIKLEGAVADVTLFPGGRARVRRDASIKLKAGRTVLVSTPLPARVDVQTLRVAFPNAGAGLTIEAVETRRELANEAALEGERAKHQQDLRAMEDKIWAKNQELGAVRDQVQNAAETLTFLNKMRTQAIQQSNVEMEVQKLDVNAWMTAIDRAEARAAKARAEQRALAGKLRTLQRQLEQLQREMNELRRKGPKQEYETRAYITVNSAAAFDGTAQLAYNVTGAYWEPFYRAQADLKKKTVRLEMLATIRQSSGEDWTNVPLAFSTARPDIGTDIPTLAPWYIRTAADPTIQQYDTDGNSPALMGIGARGGGGRRSGRFGNRANMEPRTPSAEDGSEPDATAAPGGFTPTVTATLAAEGVNTVFEAAAKSTIPSDGQQHKIPIAEMTSAIRLEHVALPKIRAQAYLRALFPNRSKFPLLPGVVEVSVGDSYVGAGMLPMTAPGQEAKLSLGVDEQVRITRNLIDEESSHSWHRDTAQKTNKFRIVATNYGAEPIHLTIYDQVPVSRDGDIKVEYDKDVKRAMNEKEFPGQVRWTLDIEPKKESVTEFGYTLYYPKGMREQLNRANQTLQYNYQRVLKRQVQQGKAAPAQVYEVDEAEESIGNDMAF